MEQALHGFTRNAAYGWWKEEKTGAIEVGKWADWIVIDKNIMEDRSGKSLRDVVVKQTWMGGRRMFPIVEGAEQEEKSMVEKILEGILVSINKILQSAGIWT